jgi:hypothetical protein
MARKINSCGHGLFLGLLLLGCAWVEVGWVGEGRELWGEFGGWYGGKKRVVAAGGFCFGWGRGVWVDG